MAAMLVGNTKSVFLRWGLKAVFMNMISAKRLYFDHQPDHACHAFPKQEEETKIIPQPL